MRSVPLLLLVALWCQSFGIAAAAEVLGIVRAEGKAHVELTIFWEPGCPFCNRAKSFLDGRLETKQWLSINAIDVTASAKNEKTFVRVNEYFHIQRPGVPLIVVGGRPFLGFDSPEGVGAAVLNAARICRRGGCPTLAALLARPNTGGVNNGSTRLAPMRNTVSLPIVGTISLTTISLPMLTVLLAAVDGFNPCAMWVLIFLVGLLVGMQDRLRMWLLGGAFLLTSGLVYFVFLAAWLNIFLLIGALFWVRLIVGLVALASGGYYLHAFATDAAAECRVTNQTQRQRIMDSLRASITERRFLAAVAGIVVLAAAVNLIELLCSAGIPAVFTDVLAMNALPTWQYYAYLILYVAVFMLDDAIIFAVAMLTLQATSMTNRYLRVSHLLGGVGMVAIGGLLIFAPQWLTFTG